MQDILDEKSITINCDSALADILDSITFIKIVVALEGEFDFEFDDEMLLITKFPTTKAMIECGRENKSILTSLDKKKYMLHKGLGIKPAMKI